MPRYFMGIDVSSFETKGVLIDDQCQIKAFHAEKHTMENPQDGYFEHDAEKVWWGDFCKVSRALIAEAGIDASEIECVCPSTLGSDCLPVDEQCRPLRKAILYGIDSRAQAEIEWMTKYYGEEKVNKLFGRPIVTGDVAAKILWIKNHEPEVYSRTYKFLTGASYLTAKLTGQYVIDQFLGQASFRPLYRTDMTINEEECSLYCRPDQLAKPHWVTDIVGSVQKEASKETNLSEGTRVITGTGDSTAEAISIGVLNPGDMMIQLGSTMFMYCCTDQLILDHRVRGNNFTVPGTFSVAAGTNAAGTLTRWYRDVMFPDALEKEKEGGPNAFTQMAEGLDMIPPGSDGLITLPYFAGERTPINDPNARGMIFGLKLSHTRAHLYKSALESVGYSIAQHVAILEEHGVELKHIIVVGGGVKNSEWLQIIADIIGKPLQVPEITIGASYGDAMMAALAAGVFKDFSELHEKIRIKQTIEPDPARHEAYEPYQKMYDRLYLENRDMMHEISGMGATKENV